MSNYRLYDLVANYHRYGDEHKEWRMDLELKFSSLIELLETLDTFDNLQIRDDTEIRLKMCLVFDDEKSGTEFISDISENSKQ